MPLLSTLLQTLRDLLDSDGRPLSDEDSLRRHINRALRVREPDARSIATVHRFVRWWFRPSLFHTERIPDRPCLFVGNHSLFGLDGLIMLPTLYQEQGRFLRPMGDRFLFRNRRIESAVLKLGGTMGHPEVARALMAHDQDVLVFPGGAHEAVKSSRERYRLQWKERLGFLRMAAEFGYPVVPFGLVGPDEFYEYLLENAEVVDLLSRLGLWSDINRRDAVPPLPRGALGTVFPRPQPCFLSFAEPLLIPKSGSRGPSTRTLQRWRDTVAERIDHEIAQMLLEREGQRHRMGLWRRIATL